MQIFIKYFAIIICSIFCYIKLLNISINKQLICHNSIFPIPLALFSIFLELKYPYIVIPLLILFLSILLSYSTKTPLEISITTTVISYGLSYLLFTLSITIVAFITVPLLPINSNIHIFLQILVSMIQLLIAPIIFRFKRLQKGMPFLKNKYYNIPGMIISITILFIAVLLSQNNYSNFYLILFLLHFICIIFIHLYWRNSISRTYIDKLHLKDMSDLNSLLLEKTQYIEKLEQENKRLAKIIHKDNKLIPAMELAVQNYISASNSEDTDALATGKQLLEELAKLSEERKGIIFQQDMQCQKLPSANVMSIDNLLTYMQQKALESDITFNVTISCDIPYLVEHIIEETELNTLLADLIENALIATRYNKGHHILLNMGIVSNAYSINIFDSGIPFTKEVLAKWCLEQITTHKDDDGSGIGLMTAYEIIKRHNASFMINEFASENGLYTKETAVLFNNLNQYILHTARTEEELAELNQRSDLIIIRK